MPRTFPSFAVLFFAALLALIAACPAYATGNGTGKIVVYYSAYNLGVNPVSYIYLDQYNGAEGVALHANRYHEFVVTPGAHTLIRHGTLGSQDSIQVHVKSGETIYVETHTGFNHWNFEVSEDQAHAKLRVNQLKPQN